MKPNKSYNCWWDYDYNKERPTIEVNSQSEPEYYVSYRNIDGEVFDLIFKPKKNPIGFRAKFL